MQANFRAALAAVLEHEGGYVDHPDDPGGATNKGITMATLRAWRGRPVSKADVRNITDAEVAAIYKANYWDKVRGDDLPSGIDYATFDFAVHSGVSRAARYLQASLGVDQDGQIGPVTLAAARRIDPSVTIVRLFSRRLAFLKSLPTWPTFGRGWERRVNEVTSHATALTGKSPRSPAPDPASPPPTPAPRPTGRKLGPVELALGALIALVAALAALRDQIPWPF